MWNRFNTALAFLTVFRTPWTIQRDLEAKELAASFSFFPLVGLILGACLCGAATALSPFTPPLVSAAIVTILYALLTRALHLDGLADLADGVGGGYTPERRLAIMKDSRTGAFGALALILVVLLRVAAIDSLLTAGSLKPLLVIPVFSRLGMAICAFRIPYARKEGGLAKPFIEEITSSHVTMAAASALVAGALISPLLLPLYVAVTAVCVFSLRSFSRSRLGGVTGDVLGACAEILEAALLTAAACAES